MTNKQLIQSFTKQTRERAEVNSLYFIGNVLYSYGPHFPLAIVTDKWFDGRRIALFNMTSYSNTTAKHQSLTRQALRDENYIVIETVTNAMHDYMKMYPSLILQGTLEGWIALSKVRAQRARSNHMQRMHLEDALKYQVQLTILKSVVL